jgi:hypothetical protein
VHIFIPTTTHFVLSQPPPPMHVPAAVPRELCLFPHLRELDLDGGHLDGPIPDWLPGCFPALEELDLSYNKVCVPGGVGGAMDKQRSAWCRWQGLQSTATPRAVGRC